MKSLIVTGAIGLVFFGGAYAFSVSRLSPDKKLDRAGEPATSVSSNITNSLFGKPDREKTNRNRASSGSPPNGSPTPSGISNNDFSNADFSSAAVVDIVNSLKTKESNLIRREKKLDSEGRKLSSMLRDIRQEKQEIEDLMTRAQTKVDENRGLLKEIKAERAQVQSELDKLNQAREEKRQAISQSTIAANEELAKLLESLEPDDFARTIEEYVANNELEKIGEYLSYVEASKASKAIQAMNDSSLRREVLESVKAAIGRKQENQALQYRRNRSR